MYGIINKAIEEYLTEQYGLDKWKNIKHHANVDVMVFQSNEPYDDNITYNLIDSASLLLNTPKNNLLQHIGKYWIKKTGREKYGSLIVSSGNTFVEFLSNLPNFHTRLMLLYHNINPPEFVIKIINPKLIHCEYHSHRNNLTHFMIGLLYGIGAIYQTDIQIVHLLCREKSGFDLFEISWN